MATSKTVIITGANSGIGHAAAQILASKGYNIVTICRKKAEGEKTASDLQRLTRLLLQRTSLSTYLTLLR